MKIRIYALLALSLLLLFSFLIGSGAGMARECGLFGGTPARLTILCAGLDDAAENTDVLMLVTLVPGQKEITVLQIPRDTYFSSETFQSKINQIYPSYRAAGADRKGAMKALTAGISEVFGIPIDHYVALDFASVAYFIDRIGGLLVDVPVEIAYGDGKTIPAGEHLLDGEAALAFIRHREGYVAGDLARMDAQKLLVVSAYRKLRNELKPTDLVTLLPDLYKRVTTDMTLSRQISFGYAYVRGREDYTVTLLTLPGEATRADGDQGTWYYIANKKAAGEVLSRYFSSASFDPTERMNDRERVHFADIYEKDPFPYRVYTEETIEKLEIKTK